VNDLSLDGLKLAAKEGVNWADAYANAYLRAKWALGLLEADEAQVLAFARSSGFRYDESGEPTVLEGGAA